MITFYRRKFWGAKSLNGIASYMGARVARNDKPVPEDTSLLIRWGCITNTNIPLSKQVNTSKGIQQASNKRQARKHMQGLCPLTIFTHEEYSGEVMVVRPDKHAKGKHLWVINNMQELVNVTSELPSWYASELVDKVSEFRVYVMSGRVISVAQKTPDDPSAVAWNSSNGGRFDVVRWSEWPTEVCRIACEAMSRFDLDFGGVDVMVDKDEEAFVLEINTAPSILPISDGSLSYRQKCMAKGFMYMSEHGRELEPTANNNGWRGYIHPAIYTEN